MPTAIRSVQSGSIRLGSCIGRMGIHEGTTKQYFDAMKDGDDFPPIVVFFDGVDYWLADGAHRLAAMTNGGSYDAGYGLGLSEVVCEVREGTADDAAWYAAGANRGHGFRPDEFDKQNAIKQILARPALAGRSNREIAKHVGCSRQWVDKVRPEAAQLATSSQLGKTEGKDGKTRPATMDAARNQRASVVEAVTSRPDATEREIAAATGASKGTVANVKKSITHHCDTHGDHVQWAAAPETQWDGSTRERWRCEVDACGLIVRGKDIQAPVKPQQKPAAAPRPSPAIVADEPEPEEEPRFATGKTKRFRAFAKEFSSWTKEEKREVWLLAAEELRSSDNAAELLTDSASLLLTNQRVFTPRISWQSCQTKG